MEIVHFGLRAALVAVIGSVSWAQCSSCSQGMVTYSNGSSYPTSGEVIYESYPVNATPQVSYAAPQGCSSCQSCSSCSSVASPIVYESSPTSYVAPASYSQPVSYSSNVTYGTPVSTSPATYASYQSPVVHSSTPQYRTTTYSSAVARPSTYSSPYQSVSYRSTSTPSSSFSSVLSIVNQKRSRAGLRPLSYDPSLTSVAQRKSYYRASRRISGHDGSSLGGARVEGVGWGSGSQGGSNGFNTCYLYSNGYSTCGAAVAYDNSGRAYYTLLLR